MDMNVLSLIRNRFLTFFGDIKIYKFPFFILYDPGSYKVKGFEVRKVIDTIEPGDILIRGYSNYLDGAFIPGFFSHAGLYLGETQKTDLVMPDVIQDFFYEGKQVVIHAMANGVFMEDIINFCKCDYLVVLRRTNQIEPNVDLGNDFRNVYTKALRNMGKAYDFKFDFSDVGNLSCTELVYVCNEHFLSLYNVKFKKRRVMMFKREMLVPDDFITGEFNIVFSSVSVNKEKLDKILTFNSQYNEKEK